MNSSLHVQTIDRKIAGIKRQLQALGLLHPGSLSAQYQVCGRAGCRCQKAAGRHGPYWKLRYVHQGAQVCRFVRAPHAAEMKSRLAVYKTFRRLLDQWIALSIQRAKFEFFSSGGKKKPKKMPQQIEPPAENL